MGYYTVNLLEAVPHPAPNVQEDMSLTQLLAIGKTCPYMPTNFRDFLRVASEMGPALRPVPNQNASPDESVASSFPNKKFSSPRAGRNGQTIHRFIASPSIWKQMKSSIQATLEKVEREKGKIKAEDPHIQKRKSIWSDVNEVMNFSPSRARQREHFRMAHARDGINEMHPDVMSQFVGGSDDEAVGGSPNGASDTSILSPTVKKRRQFSLEWKLFTEDGDELTKDEAGNSNDLAHRISSSCVSNIVTNEDQANKNMWGASLLKEGSESSPVSPSQILFSAEEIIVLKLIFSLFDQKGKEFVSRDDIRSYAEESGDYAQLKEIDTCMEALDADQDDKISLHDYINFAARLKAIYEMRVEMENEMKGLSALEGESDESCDDMAEF
eukprot:CAMPEP_0171470130 /NCGR_PEP_ID=MMETSP0945-20130129/11740_1 /TAXON_ID=109269 /ORGANISM="Vaucheria litorea, Strain CCMP2940" /LENGTH=383 /DNA_ID=CAMNT_0011999493 /DNA_START=221 /DNA_END=1372 /DNA_ORIENTATION=-